MEWGGPGLLIFFLISFIRHMNWYKEIETNFDKFISTKLHQVFTKMLFRSFSFFCIILGIFFTMNNTTFIKGRIILKNYHIEKNKWLTKFCFVQTVSVVM